MIDLSNRRSVFKDKKLEREFREQGFAVVSFLNEEKIKELKTLYSELYPEGVKGFFSTTFADNLAHRETVNKSIKRICLEEISRLFYDFKIFFSSFIVKAAGKNSELIMHQDMSLLDETQFAGINIWCPLVDLNSKNGAIQLLPKSHRFFHTYRGSSLPDIYDNVSDELKPLLQSLFLNAGEAVIFDQSIIHYSPPNLSEIERPVINTFIAHQQARIKICYWDKNLPNKIEVFEQEDDFFEQFENFGKNIFNRPTIGKSLGMIDYNFPKLTMELVRNELNLSENKEEDQSWLKKLFNFKK